jgi:RNA-directed DNA polymerase
VLVDGAATDQVSGTPQGSPIFPLLANIALPVLDRTWMETSGFHGALVTYADDFVVLCTYRIQPRRPGAGWSRSLVLWGLS